MKREKISRYKDDVVFVGSKFEADNIPRLPIILFSISFESLSNNGFENIDNLFVWKYIVLNI